MSYDSSETAAPNSCQNGRPTRRQTIPHTSVPNFLAGSNLRRTQSETRPGGRWIKRIISRNGSKSSIETALGSVAQFASAPLQGSLYPMLPGVTVASDDTTVSPGPASVVRSPYWASILTPPSPTGDDPNLRTERDSLEAPERSRLERTPNVPPETTTPTDTSDLSARIKRKPSPLLVPQRAEHSHIIAINPDHTQVIEPGTTPRSSPTSITPSTITRGQNTSSEIQESASLDNIEVEVSRLATLISSYYPTSRQQTQSTVSSYSTAPQWCERKMLIIGSSYETDTGRTSTRLSTISAWDPLPAMQHDVVDLESTFRTRGYHVETMPHECFDRQGVLDEVARFLQCALPGDVRAIVFTGHSTETSEGPPAMVLPGIHSEFTITSQDWNRNIRANARPGVIVVSILATCFAGGFVDQGVRITDFAHLKEVEDCASLNAPILVTFSSSGSQERSYESPIHEHEPRDRDHFLWALATTAREPSVRTWQQFNTKLRDAFALARTAGSMYAGEGALRWMWDHPQCPVFATTTPGFIPPLHSIFPVAGKILA